MSRTETFPFVSCSRLVEKPAESVFFKTRKKHFMSIQAETLSDSPAVHLSRFPGLLCVRFIIKVEPLSDSLAVAKYISRGQILYILLHRVKFPVCPNANASLIFLVFSLCFQDVVGSSSCFFPRVEAILSWSLLYSTTCTTSSLYRKWKIEKIACLHAFLLC